MKKNKKNTSRVGKVFGIIFSILLVAATMFLLFQLVKLNVLPTKLLFLVTVVFVLLDLIFVLLLCFVTKGFVSKFICIIFTIAISLGSCMGGYYMSKTGGLLSNITNVATSSKNTVSVVVKKSSSIKKKNDLNGKNVGVLKSIGTVGSKKVLKDLSSSNIDVTKKQYDSMTAMLEALFKGDVDAIVINACSLSNKL